MDSTNLLNQIAVNQTQKEVTANENFSAASPAMLFGRDAVTSGGLTWGFTGGRFFGNPISGGTLTLTASATNYVTAVKNTGTVSVLTTTTRWDNQALYIRLYSVITGAAGVTSYQDFRNGIISDQNPTIVVNTQTGTTYSYLGPDRYGLVTHSNAGAIAATLPQAGSSFPNGAYMYVQNTGAGALTITPTTSTIDGAASLVLTTGQGAVIVSNGTNYNTMRGGGSSGGAALSANTFTGMQTMRAGAAGAGTAPIKMQSGALNTTPEVGAIEFLTDTPSIVITTGAARKEFALNDAPLSSGRVPFATTNGRLVDHANYNYNSTTNTLLVGSAAAGNATFRFYAKESANGQSASVMENSSAGTGAFCGWYAINDVASNVAILKLGSGYTTSGLLSANASLIVGSSGSTVIGGAADTVIVSGGTATGNEWLRLDANLNVSIGNAALATTATNGFFYIPTCAGTPTGTPTAKTGRVPIIVDSTALKFWVYVGGAWKYAQLV